MKEQITRAQARAFRKRWDIVNAEETRQLRRTPMARKLQQLNVLFAWGKYFGWKESRANEAEEVRNRWIKLRRLYRG